MKSFVRISRLEVSAARREPAAWLEDSVVVEAPVALVCNGTSYAVMMATPADLEDFAVGFSLGEGIIQHPRELYEIELDQSESGISLHLRISARREFALKAKRKLIGVTSCGICGVESLAEAREPTPSVDAPELAPAAIQHATMELRAFQPLLAETGASHAAAWCDLEGRVLLVREDAGRHNALDKMIGALAREQRSVTEGFALVSSRASFEMVHRSCRAGIGALVAVSAPTSLAIERARQAGQLLVGFARSGRHVIYNLPNGKV